MARRELNLDVSWPDGRAVRVHVHVAPVLGMRHDYEERVGARPIGADEVASLPDLQSFLRDATRFAAAGETVEAVCFTPHYFEMLKLLGVEGPPPDRIAVTLPKG